MSIDIDSICKDFCIMLNNEPMNIYIYIYIYLLVHYGTLWNIIKMSIDIDSIGKGFCIMFHNEPINIYIYIYIYIYWFIMEYYRYEY